MVMIYDSSSILLRMASIEKKSAFYFLVWTCVLLSAPQSRQDCSLSPRGIKYSSENFTIHFSVKYDKISFGVIKSEHFVGPKFLCGCYLGGVKTADGSGKFSGGWITLKINSQCYTGFATFNIYYNSVIFPKEIKILWDGWRQSD